MLDRENNVITDLSQLKEWKILELTRFKPGVVQYRAMRKSGSKMEHITGYAKDEVFKSMQLPKD